MVRLNQLCMVRAAALVALQQNKLAPAAYDGVLQWIERMERQSPSQANDHAIRQASAVMIGRLGESTFAI